MTCGIYKLVFKDSDKVYIGLSTNIEKRWATHRRTFHQSIAARKLQEAYNTFGMPSIVVECVCEESRLPTMELEYIKKYSSVENGFNTSSGGNSGTSSSGDSNYFSKHSNTEIEQAFLCIINNPESTYKEISEITGVSKDAIAHIAAGSTHKWLKDKYPEKYEELIQRKEERLSNKRKQIPITRTVTRIYRPIISPGGKEYIVDKISTFAKEHNLNSGNLSRLLKGKLQHCKGWTLKEDIK